MVPTVIKQYVVERDGEGCVAGHGYLEAEYVARMHVNGGRPIEYVMEHYGLTRAEVHGVLAWFYENQEVLDAEQERGWAESKARDADDLIVEIKARTKATEQQPSE